MRRNVGCNLSIIANYLNRDTSTVSRYVKKNCLVVKKIVLLIQGNKYVLCQEWWRFRVR